MTQLFPVDLLILQMTQFCNINCSYCYLPHRTSLGQIDKSIVTAALQRVFEYQAQDRPFTLVFHAGEPLAAPIEVFRHAADESLRLARGSIYARLNVQTNGTLINDEWCLFFSKYDVKVGVSLDGPDWINDKYRKFRSGKGAFSSTMKGIKLLKRHGIPFHIISVLTRDALPHAKSIYEFFKDLEPTSVGFNIDEEDGSNQSSTIYGCDDGEYKLFWNEMFRVWLNDSGRLQIREFQGFLDLVRRGGDLPDSIDSNQTNRPFSILTVQSDGGVSTFSPELAAIGDGSRFIYGNVLRDTLASIYETPIFQNDLRAIRRGIDICKSSCEYFEFCGGGSPSNKYAEQSSFEISETLYCRYSKKLLIDEILAGDVTVLEGSQT